MSKNENKRSFRKLGLRIAKATLITAVAGIFWLVLWLLISSFLANFPEYLTRFAVLAWALLFFTFAIKVSEGTIYKYILIIIRAFYLSSVHCLCHKLWRSHNQNRKFHFQRRIYTLTGAYDCHKPFSHG